MRRKIKGSFTVEAAVIVPISMGIIVTLICFGLYLHDAVIIETVGPAAVLEAAGRYSSTEQSVKSEVQEMLEKRLSSARGFSVDIKGEEDVRITIEAGFDRPLKGLISSPGLSGIKTDINLSNLNGRKQVLKYKMIKDGVKSLTEGSKDNGDQLQE